MNLITFLTPSVQSLGEALRKADSPTIKAMVDGGDDSGMGMLIVGALGMALFAALPVGIAMLRGQHQYLVKITMGSMFATFLTFTLIGLPIGLVLWLALIILAAVPRLAQKVLG